MQIVYTRSTQKDIAWISRYYSNIFPEGRASFRSQLYASESVLSASPYIGHIIDEIPSIREFRIVKTPFSLIYRVTATRIEILRVWDQRQDNAKFNLEGF